MKKATSEWLKSAQMDLDNVAEIIHLDDLYIESRYPSELGLLPSGKPTPAEAREFFETAKSLFDQIGRELAGDKGQ